MKRLSARFRKVVFGKKATQGTISRNILLTTCASMQLLTNAGTALGATAPASTGTTQQTSGPAPIASGSFSNTSNLSMQPTNVSASVGPAALPGQGTIGTAVLSAIGNTVTNSKNSTLIIDVSKQATPGTYSYSGTFNNAGTVYLVSSNPNIHNAVLQAGSIYNQMSGIITTVIPSKGLQGYSGLVQNLGLTLAATNYVLNSGTVSSAAALNISAGTQVINALPQGVNSNQVPIMSAMSGLSIITPSLINSGQISATVGNININSLIGGNLYINNVAGSIAALNGLISVTTDQIAKTNLTVLGGVLSATQVNMTTGTGLLDLQVDQMNGILNVIAGDGYISTASSGITLGSVLFSGDPIVNSGGIIEFRPEPGSTVCVGSGVFSGTQAIASCTEIDTTGLVLNLSGSANLAGVDIVSTSGLSINAGTGISTGNITTQASTVLSTSSGNIQTGNIQTGNQGAFSYVQLQTGAGAIATGNLNLGGGLFVTSAQGFTAGNVNINGGTGVGMITTVNQATPFAVGGSAGIASFTLNNTGTNTVVYLRNSGSGGISIDPSKLTVNAPNALAQIAIDAGTQGTINLGAGKMSLDTNTASGRGIFALSAAKVTANGTTLSANNSFGQAGVIVIGANVIDTGAGLNLHADGIGGRVFVGGTGAVTTTVTNSPPVQVVQTTWNGSTNLPLTVNGTALNATANGLAGQIIVNASTMQLNTKNVSVHADGTGLGLAGYVQVAAYNLINSSNIDASANGAGSDFGGLVNVQSAGPNTNLTVASGKLTASANGGTLGGDGGQVYLYAGGTLSVDTGSISASALNGNANGGLVQVVGGSNGFPGGGVVFTNQSPKISVDGKGFGSGGTVQAAAFGIGSTLVMPEVSANGGDNGSGGTIQATSNGTLTVAKPLSANAGTAGNGSGGNVDLNSSGSANLSASITANAAGNGTGGVVSVYASGSSSDLVQSSSIQANGKTGGQLYLAADRTLTINGNVSANGQAGFVQIDSSIAAVGDLNVNGSVAADGLQAGTFLWSHNGNLNIGSATTTGHVSAIGGTTVSLRSAVNTTIGAGSTVSGNATGNSADINIAAGMNGPGVLQIAGNVTSNSQTGTGGNISLSQSSLNPMVISGSVTANSAAGQGGQITLSNRGQDLTLSLNGVLDTTGSDFAHDGTVFINNPGKNVTISGTGEIDGNIKARTAQISISTSRPETSLHPYDFNCSGAISITNSGATSTIKLVPGAQIITPGNITLKADNLILGDGSTTNLPIIQGENVLITKTHDGDLDLACNITANQQLVITLQGNGSVFQSRDNSFGAIGNLTAGNTSFSINTGIVGTEAEKINLTTDSVSVQTSATAQSSEAFFQLNPKSSDTVNIGPVNLVSTVVNGQPIGGHLIIDSSTANLRINGLVVTSGDAIITTSDHNIVINSSLLAGPLVTLQCVGSGSIIQSNPLSQVVGTKQINLSADSVVANTAGPNLSVFAQAGSATINHTGNVTFVLTNVRDTFNLTVANGSILANSAPIRAASLNITCTTGNVGDFTGPAALPVNVSVDNLTVNAMLGAVSIQNTKTSTLTINSSQSFGNMTIRSNGPITTIGPLSSSNGGLALVSTGDLRISGLPFLTAGNGNLVLQNTNSASVIEFDFGARLRASGDTTSGGNIAVFIGDSPAQVDGPAPANFVAAAVNGGHIYWGNDVVKPGNPDTEQPNVLGADGRNITFSGPSNQQVIFHGGALISAQGTSGGNPGGGGDPPGQTRPSPGQTGQNPGLGGSNPPGQGLFNPPGQSNNPGNSDPPGQSQTPPGQQKKAMAPVEQEEFRTVAFCTIVPAESCASNTLGCTETQLGNFWSLGLEKLLTNSNSVQLNEGEILMLAKRDITVHTSHANISVKAGTLLACESSKSGLVLIVLKDRSANSVALRTMDGAKITLSMGEQICLSKHKLPLRLSVNVPMRKEATFQFGVMNAHLAEISPMALLSKHSLIKTWFKSSDLTGKKELLKTIAALSVVTNAHGPYKN